MPHVVQMSDPEGQTPTHLPTRFSIGRRIHAPLRVGNLNGPKSWASEGVINREVWSSLASLLCNSWMRPCRSTHASRGWSPFSDGCDSGAPRILFERRSFGLFGRLTLRRMRSGHRKAQSKTCHKPLHDRPWLSTAAYPMRFRPLKHPSSSLSPWWCGWRGEYGSTGQAG